jgi:hypothetical protein
VSVANALSPGDVYGFVALFLIALAAVLMLFRSKLLKVTRNITLVRTIHVVVSTSAGLFLILHLTALFSLPVSTGIAIGYAAVIVSVAVWLSGTAFLEKARDSLFFHGVLSSVLIPLSLIHAANAGSNLPLDWTQAILGTSAVVVLANAALHLRKAFSHI